MQFWSGPFWKGFGWIVTPRKQITSAKFRPRNPWLKNGVNSFVIKRLHKNWTIRILVTGCWMLVKKVASPFFFYKIDRIPH